MKLTCHLSANIFFTADRNIPVLAKIIPWFVILYTMKVDTSEA
jgi:hypothetical protein